MGGGGTIHLPCILNVDTSSSLVSLTWGRKQNVRSREVGLERPCLILMVTLALLIVLCRDDKLRVKYTERGGEWGRCIERVVKGLP